MTRGIRQKTQDMRHVKWSGHHSHVPSRPGVCYCYRCFSFGHVLKVMDLPSSPVSGGSSPWELADSLSGSDGGSVRETGAGDPAVAPKVWWAQKLMMHTATLGLMTPTLQNPVTCVSACTGSFAEGFVFEVRGSGFVCVCVMAEAFTGEW